MAQARDRTCAVFALTALAIAQPLFDVLARSPEFFVARNTTLGVVVSVAGVLCVLLPLAVITVERAIGAFSERAATLAHGAVVALLTASMVAPWLARGGLSGASHGTAAAAIGLAIALGSWRLATLRLFLAALVPAAFVVPGVFLFDRNVREALVPGTTGLAATATAAIERTPPLVLVVFDEFPLNSLLDERREIDAERYPNFAALARDAYWFRNASTVTANTVWAVPAIVSGRYPLTPDAVPTLRYYPNNLFTLLASRYEMFVFGRFLQLCPESVCHHDLEMPGESTTALLADLSIVWLHIVLPAPLSDRLPPIVGDWQGFARARRWRSDGVGRERNERGAEFDRFLSTIDGRPAQLHFLHTLLPHMPFEYVPSGRRYRAPDYQGRQEQGSGLFERASPEYADALHQRHLLQVGFVDALMGRLTARLHEVGAYDSALVIVTADHGASYREGAPRRNARAENAADILLVPLLVKMPGQTQGVIVDRSVETIDILPTIAAALSAGMPFAVDGRSLFDHDAPERGKTFIRRSLSNVAIEAYPDWALRGDASLRRKLWRFGRGEAGLYSTPDSRELLGQPLTRFATRDGGVRVDLDNLQQFGAVDMADELLPLHVRGQVQGGAAPPVTLAVAVNGVIAATTASYEEAGAHVFGTLLPEEHLRSGANDIAVFVVEHERDRFALRSTGSE